MNTTGSGLSELLAAEAARFTLEATDSTARAGVVELESLRDRKPLGVGIYVKHLATGEEAGFRPDVVFEAQSVIKIALAIRAYGLADEGRLDLDERVRVTKSDVQGGTGVIQYFQEGLEPTVRDLLTAMIVVSDNSATDLLLARTGGIAGLNAWLAASGYPRTRMAQSVLDSVRLPYVLVDPRHAALTAEQVHALRTGDPHWAGMTQDRFDAIESAVAALATRPLAEVRTLARERRVPLSFGDMTPREAGRMLESIERATAVSASSSGELRLNLRRQQLGERRLPGLVPYPVGHKTGDSPPWDANDVGIVYSPSGPIVVTVFANDLGGDYAREEDRIGRIGRMVVDHFERVT
jgi:beta-lactamase class A